MLRGFCPFPKLIKSKVKLPLSTPKRHTAAIEVQFHLFLTSAGNLTSRLFYRWYLLSKRPGGPHNPSGCSEEEENFMPLSVIKPCPLVAACTNGFYIKKFYVLPKGCTYVFCTNLRI
jgi:hypothetical protein